MSDGTRATKSGINADVEKKREKDYDPEVEEKAQRWMEEVTGVSLEGGFYPALQDGSYLCNLFNKLYGDIIPGKHTNPTTKKFPQIDNINAFLTACKKFGMDEKDLFVTVDLHEFQNKNMVLSSIYNLGRHVQKNPEYRGPILGPKEAEPQPRYFDEQKIREGRNVSSLQMGTNQVASQGGMTPYGMGRQVYNPKLD